MYIFKESTRRCAINHKGRGRKEVIYLRVADVSCTRSVYKSTGLSYRDPCSGVPWHTITKYSTTEDFFIKCFITSSTIKSSIFIKYFAIKSSIAKCFSINYSILFYLLYFTALAVCVYYYYYYYYSYCYYYYYYCHCCYYFQFTAILVTTS